MSSLDNSAAARALREGSPATGSSFRLHRPRGALCGEGWCGWCDGACTSARVRPTDRLRPARAPRRAPAAVVLGAPLPPSGTGPPPVPRGAAPRLVGHRAAACTATARAAAVAGRGARHRDRRRRPRDRRPPRRAARGGDGARRLRRSHARRRRPGRAGRDPLRTPRAPDRQLGAPAAGARQRPARSRRSGDGGPPAGGRARRGLGQRARRPITCEVVWRGDRAPDRITGRSRVEGIVADGRRARVRRLPDHRARSRRSSSPCRPAPRCG